jgi:hypothetical protein
MTQRRGNSNTIYNMKMTQYASEKLIRVNRPWSIWSTLFISKEKKGTMCQSSLTRTKTTAGDTGRKDI